MSALLTPRDAQVDLYLIEVTWGVEGLRPGATQWAIWFAPRSSFLL